MQLFSDLCSFCSLLLSPSYAIMLLSVSDAGGVMSVAWVGVWYANVNSYTLDLKSNRMYVVEIANRI